MPANRLAAETSPYLQQHADNPVDWWPWGEEALTLARTKNKPILLSIGYSACHWCHVMAHESFEDPATAALMNRHYINIKVDREERPDLDKIYQGAHQLLNQRAGGWPLTAFLTPDDLTPFFVGTYFPPQPRHGMVSFADLLEKVIEYYRDNEAAIRQQNHSLRSALQQDLQAGEVKDADLNPAPLDQACQQLARSFDQEYGGFGAAPKFPHPTSLERLLRHWSATREQTEQDKESLNMALQTLRGMAAGGMFDQLGGGFYRYSVDEMWMIPHFEKMLYDNGPLLALYADAWAITGDDFFKRIAAETGEWVLREMQAPQGGYYSSLDADTEGEEGRFYVWTPAEVQQHLNEEEYKLFAALFGLNRGANFEGRWHLHTYQSLERTADKLNIDIRTAHGLFDRARQKLMAIRQTRVRPGRDEKILTSWNALMIKGMAIAGRRLQREDFIDSAQQAVRFIRATLYKDGRLLATSKDGQARLMAYLDDYVFLLDALLELLQSRWDTDDLHMAIALADNVLSHFEDGQQGGFYFTANDHEQLFHRPKPYSDESIPAGNGVAAYALQRLGHLIGEQRYLDAAERTLRAAWPEIRQIPYAHCALLLAVEENLYPLTTVVIRGQTEELAEWQPPLHATYAPAQQCYSIPASLIELPGLLGERKPGTQTVAYVCSGVSCKPPIHKQTDLHTTIVPPSTLTNRTGSD